MSPVYRVAAGFGSPAAPTGEWLWPTQHRVVYSTTAAFEAGAGRGGLLHRTGLIGDSAMPFNPKELTPATVKGFVDRLHRFAKTTDASAWPPKRAWSQEAIARALGFPSYHALHLALEALSKPRERSSGHPVWAFDSPSGRPFFRVSDEWYLHRTSQTGFSVPMDLWKEPLLIQGDERERRKLFGSIAEQAISHALPVLLIQGPWALSAPALLTETPFRTSYSLGWALNALLVRRSAGSLTEMLVDLMEDAGSKNNMWNGRAISMVSSLLMALVHLRDKEGQPLTVSVLSDAMRLESIHALCSDSRLPAHVLQALNAYMRSIPGGDRSLNGGGFTEVMQDQHGYLQMQLSAVLASVDDQENVLRLSNRHALSLSESTDVLPIFPLLVEDWAAQNPRGVLLLDGLSGKSSILKWLPKAIPRLVEQGIRVALGTRYLNDWALPAEAMQPLLSRFPNGFIMDGAADDPWVDHAAKAGWKTVQGRG